VLDKTTVRKIAARYAKEARQALDPEAVVLFGSYVDGAPHEWSDIDIAVIVSGFEGDWLKTASTLHSLTRKVSLDIEPHLLDAASDPSGFAAHVLKTGEVVCRSAA
jgi:predicted nucleotidyltransferase